MIYKQCVICGKSNNKTVFKEFDVDILKCKNCGHVFSSYEAKQDYDGYYGEKVKDDDHYWWDKAHEKMYNDFCDKFIENKKGKLLDVGCGLGYFVKKIKNYSDWEVYGYEISKPAVDFAKDKLGLQNIFQGKVEDSDFKEKYFDIITLWDVIEHIPKLAPMLSYLNKVLKDDGVLFIHTPNIQSYCQIWCMPH
jgi:2-polyprenyl-3-methyl-5-hydroxy-6-metoxy-1,4-benzoquinol methylase